MSHNPEKYFPFIEHRYKRANRTQKLLYGWLVPFYFSSIEVRGVDNLLSGESGFPRKSRDEPVCLYALRHRSHFDYAISLWVLMQNGKWALSMGGDNLFIGPVDAWLRKRGAFKAERFVSQNHKKVFYSPYWLQDYFYKSIAETRLLKPLLPEPMVVTRTTSLQSLEKYVKKIVGEGYDTQVFAEVGEAAAGKTRGSGRSKTGELNEFSTIIFKMFLKASAETGRPIMIFPVNESYEKVIEDTNMTIIQKMKQRFGPKIAYTYDLFYNLLSFMHWNSRLPEVTVNIGRPFEFSAKAYSESHEQQSRDASGKATINKISSHYAARAREEIGRLEVPYPSQLLAKSVFDVLTEESGLSINQFVEANSGSGMAIRVDKEKVREKVPGNFYVLREKGVGTEKLSRDGNPPSLEEILKKSSPVLNTSFGGTIYSYDKEEISVEDLGAFSQYANHIIHLF